MNEERADVAALLLKYAPEMDFADATLVRASEIFPTFTVVTTDRHFDWYRRFNGRDKIPVLKVPD